MLKNRLSMVNNSHIFGLFETTRKTKATRKLQRENKREMIDKISKKVKKLKGKLFSAELSRDKAIVAANRVIEQTKDTLEAVRTCDVWKQSKER